MSNHPGRFIKIILLAACCLWFGLVSSHSQTISTADGCIACHTTLDAASRQIATLHQQSAHGQAGLSCAACHGGDDAQRDNTKAHAAMIAKPVLLAACGRCHQAQLAQFKTSRHFQTRQNEPRPPQLDCAECHGVHSIGRPAESFSFTQYCAGCHGLEYLPALPQPFQDLLALSDELRETFQQPTLVIGADAQKQRREIRRLTAELVHPTDRAGGLARIPSILAQGAKLRAQLKTEK